MSLNKCTVWCELTLSDLVVLVQAASAVSKGIKGLIFSSLEASHRRADLCAILCKE